MSFKEDENYRKKWWYEKARALKTKQKKDLKRCLQQLKFTWNQSNITPSDWHRWRCLGGGGGGGRLHVCTSVRCGSANKGSSDSWLAPACRRWMLSAFSFHWGRGRGADASCITLIRPPPTHTQFSNLIEPAKSDTVQCPDSLKEFVNAAFWTGHKPPPRCFNVSPERAVCLSLGNFRPYLSLSCFIFLCRCCLQLPGHMESSSHFDVMCIPADSTCRPSRQL